MKFRNTNKNLKFNKLCAKELNKVKIIEYIIDISMNRLQIQVCINLEKVNENTCAMHVILELNSIYLIIKRSKKENKSSSGFKNLTVRKPKLWEIRLKFTCKSKK